MSWHEDLTSMDTCVARKSAKNKNGLDKAELLALCKLHDIKGLNSSSTKEVMCKKLNEYFSSSSSKPSAAKQTASQSTESNQQTEVKPQDSEDWSIKSVIEDLFLLPENKKSPVPVKVKKTAPKPAPRPAHHFEVKPVSPIKLKSPSPVKVKPLSPVKVKPLSPVKVKPLSPVKVKPLSPVKVKSLSPVKVKSLSPGKVARPRRKIMLKPNGILKYKQPQVIAPVVATIQEQKVEDSDIIGQGGNGCVYFPPLKCSGPGDVAPCRNCITKISSRRSSINELTVFDELGLNRLDPEGNWHIKKPTLCNVKPPINPPCKPRGRDLEDPIGLTYENGGITLREVISDITKANIKDTLVQFSNILHGLDVMHSSRAYHLDIKADNIVTGQLGRGPFKLIDFGMSKRLTEEFDSVFDATQYSLIWPLDAVVLSRDVSDMTPAQKRAFVTRHIETISLENSLIIAYYGRQNINMTDIINVIVDLISKPNAVKIYDSMSKIDVYSIGMLLYIIGNQLLRLKLNIEGAKVLSLVRTSNILHVDPTMRPTIAEFSMLYNDLIRHWDRVKVQVQVQGQALPVVPVPVKAKAPIAVQFKAAKPKSPPVQVKPLNPLETQLIAAQYGKNVLFTAANVVTAVEAFLKHNIITNNTLVVFDMDDTLFKSNSDKQKGIRPTETVLDDFTLAQLQTAFAQIKATGANIAIVSGRDADQLPQSRTNLAAMNLPVDHLVFVSNSKADAIRKITTGKKNVIYFDDFMLGGAADIVLQLNRFKISSIGVKVGVKDESINYLAYDEDDIARYTAAMAPGARAPW